jgi:hypothetical protein
MPHRAGMLGYVNTQILTLTNTQAKELGNGE